MSRLRDLYRAEGAADEARRAAAAIPEVLRPPGAAAGAYAAWQQAHADLQAALAEPEPAEPEASL